jgi:hypothetical protein
MSKNNPEVSPIIKEKYNELLNAVLNKEPVTFKKVFEDVMRLKATKYVGLVKEEMEKSVFNVSESYNDRLDEDYDPAIEFHVMDKKAGYPVGKYSNIKRARNALDKRQNEYGGDSNHRIEYYHKEKRQYVPFSQTAKSSE